MEEKEKEKFYSIGEAGEICNVSKKALRYYEKIGIIAPDYVNEENGYRYYSRKTLLKIPIIKYYKQMGFRLEEMKSSLLSDSYEDHELGFRNKIDELQIQKRDIEVAYKSVSEWYNLIVEANNVLRNNATEVSVKFLPLLTTCYLSQIFEGDYREAIINIDWTNYLEKIGNAISGPVMMYFPDARAKARGEATQARVFQEILRPPGDNPIISIGGYMTIACYHIGSHATIGETYQKMFDWADQNGYTCGESSVERYVTDYWTINNEQSFVTEILMEAFRKD